VAAPKKSALPFLRWLLLLPLPLLWCVADITANWISSKTKRRLALPLPREIAAPVKIVYVDVDSESLQVIGNWPWSRALLSQVCSALITQAGVKAIGLDIVTSDVGQSQLADHTRLVSGNLEFATFLRKSPPVVLAASFSASTFYDHTGALRQRELPLLERIGVRSRRSRHRDASVRSAQQSDVSPELVGLIDTLDGDTRWVRSSPPPTCAPITTWRSSWCGCTTASRPKA